MQPNSPQPTTHKPSEDLKNLVAMKPGAHHCKTLEGTQGCEIFWDMVQHLILKKNASLNLDYNFTVTYVPFYNMMLKKTAQGYANAQGLCNCPVFAQMLLKIYTDFNSFNDLPVEIFIN